MDDRTFDARVRALGKSANRRAVLGGLAALAGLGVAQASAKPPKRGKVRGSAAADKVTICHYDKDAGTYTKISVGAKAAESHLEHHEDFKPKDCCSNNDCSGGKICNGEQGCVCPGTGGACYWLSNRPDSTFNTWIPSPNDAPTLQDCRGLDGCNGGGNASGGGCYRWQDSTACVVAPPWPTA